MSDRLVIELLEDIALGRDVRSVAGHVDDVAQAYDIQDKICAELGPVCGRKIAANAPALMEKAGIDKPIVGMITGQAAMVSGAELRISDFAQLALEPEFAAVVGEDVPAGTVLTTETLRGHVERFSLAFEVLDRRNDMHPLHGPTFIVNNVFNAGVILDDAALDINALEQGAYTAKFTAVGDVLVSGDNTAPQDPLAACAFVINHFTARGEDVKAGEVILCGAHHPPMVIDAAGTYTFSLSTGEEVNLSISA